MYIYIVFVCWMNKFIYSTPQASKRQNRAVQSGKVWIDKGFLMPLRTAADRLFCSDISFSSRYKAQADELVAAQASVAAANSGMRSVKNPDDSQKEWLISMMCLFLMGFIF